MFPSHFTQTYTPQENGPVESFHTILIGHLKCFTFWSIEDLENNLILFQEKYNSKRLYGSIAHLCPNDFRILWWLGYIQMGIHIKLRKSHFQTQNSPP
ncbi:integrase core domain-containing protein [Muriicola sp.]|uniref:integrase core domain-containing protein n=1 Tax=Muriicola sp. TaxID=2020856 RepID=UPI003C78A616